MPSGGPLTLGAWRGDAISWYWTRGWCKHLVFRFTSFFLFLGFSCFLLFFICLLFCFLCISYLPFLFLFFSYFSMLLPMMFSCKSRSPVLFLFLLLPFSSFLLAFPPPPFRPRVSQECSEQPGSHLLYCTSCRSGSPGDMHLLYLIPRAPDAAIHLFQIVSLTPGWVTANLFARSAYACLW